MFDSPAGGAFQGGGYSGPKKPSIYKRICGLWKGKNPDGTSKLSGGIDKEVTIMPGRLEIFDNAKYKNKEGDCDYVLKWRPALPKKDGGAPKGVDGAELF